MALTSTERGVSFTLVVNDTPVGLDLPGTVPLLQVLRNDLGLNGPKYGCGLGQCGACTVLIDGVPARSCILPLSVVSGRRVTTLEGLARNGELHPVQRAFVEEQAAQCGYCLNGMIMTVVALLDRDPAPDEAKIRRELAGNLCRCGTHLEILRAARRAATAMTGVARSAVPTVKPRAAMVGSDGVEGRSRSGAPA